MTKASGGGVPFEQRDRRARTKRRFDFLVEKIEASEREANTRSPDQILIAIMVASRCAWSKIHISVFTAYVIGSAP